MNEITIAGRIMLDVASFFGVVLARAASESRFADCYSVADDSPAVPVQEWLKLPPDQRGAAKPTVPGPNGERLAVGGSFCAAVPELAARRDTLRELAGVVRRTSRDKELGRIEILEVPDRFSIARAVGELTGPVERGFIVVAEKEAPRSNSHRSGCRKASGKARLPRRTAQNAYAAPALSCNGSTPMARLLPSGETSVNR